MADELKGMEDLVMDSFSGITLKKFREATKDLKEDTRISFLFRDNILSDKGIDAMFTPTAIWLGQDAETKEANEVILVGVIPPEVTGDEECGCGCDCGDGECDDDCDCDGDCGDECTCQDEEDPSKLN